MPVHATFSALNKQDLQLSVGGTGSVRQDLSLYVASPQTLHFDLRLSVTAPETARQDLRLLVNPVTSFIYGGQGVYFFTAPLKNSGGRSLRKNQRRDYGSDGSRYVYRKGVTERRYPFELMLDKTTLAELRGFVRDTVQGVRRKFTWLDLDGVSRQVRLEYPDLDWQQVGPNRYRVKFALIEEQP